MSLCPLAKVICSDAPVDLIVLISGQEREYFPVKVLCNSNSYQEQKLMRRKRIKALEYYIKISRIWRKTGIKHEEKKIKFGSSREFFTDTSRQSRKKRL